MMAFGGDKSFRVEVKPSKREPFAPVGWILHAGGLQQAREHAAFIFQVPRRWVRARRITKGA